MGATVKFKLNHPERKKDNDLVSINVFYYSTGQRIELATGERIPKSKWNGNRVKPSYLGYDKINKHLTSIEDQLNDLWRHNKGVQGADLKNLVKKIVQGESQIEPAQTESKTLSKYILTFIKKCEEGKIIRSASTISQYKQTLDILEAFAKKDGIELSFEAVTLDFYYNLTSYLWDTLKYNDNSVGKAIKNLKMFMQTSFDDDLHNNMAFKKKKFRKPSFETNEIYLTSDEILKIYNLDLHDSPELAAHRDLFVFNCWVGVRFGDLCSIRNEQIIQTKEGKYLKVRTEKTGEDVVIPFHPLCEAIYSYYNGHLPNIEKTQNPVFNISLKTIAAKAELNDKFQSKNIKRGKALITYYEKHEMVCAHTARRSFATNCYLMGVPSITIMAITGHRTEKAFLKYIRVTKDQHAKIMMNHFNTTPIMGALRKAN
jgi:integrase